LNKSVTRNSIRLEPRVKAALRSTLYCGDDLGVYNSAPSNGKRTTVPNAIALAYAARAALIFFGRGAVHTKALNLLLVNQILPNYVVVRKTGCS